jgi:hypothetical protein
MLVRGNEFKIIFGPTRFLDKTDPALENFIEV